MLPSLLVLSVIISPMVSLAKEGLSLLPSLRCKVRHSFGILCGYSGSPKVGDKATLNLEKLAKKGPPHTIQFSSGTYVPLEKPFQLENEQRYSTGKVSSQWFRSRSSTSSSVVLGISCGVGGPYDARASVDYEDGEIWGIVLPDCNISGQPNK